METVQPSKSKVVHKAHHLCFFQWTLQMQFFFVFVVTVLQILIFTAWNDVHKLKKMHQIKLYIDVCEFAI